MPTESTVQPIEAAVTAARKLGWEVVVFIHDLGGPNTRGQSHAVVSRIPDHHNPEAPYVVHILHTFEDGTASGLSHGDYDLGLPEAIERAHLRVKRGY